VRRRQEAGGRGQEGRGKSLYYSKNGYPAMSATGYAIAKYPKLINELLNKLKKLKYLKQNT
jgi:hypothetical protein